MPGPCCGRGGGGEDFVRGHRQLTGRLTTSAQLPEKTCANIILQEFSYMALCVNEVSHCKLHTADKHFHLSEQLSSLTTLEGLKTAGSRLGCHRQNCICPCITPWCTYCLIYSTSGGGGGWRGSTPLGWQRRQACQVNASASCPQADWTPQPSWQPPCPSYPCPSSPGRRMRSRHLHQSVPTLTKVVNTEQSKRP